MLHRLSFFAIILMLSCASCTQLAATEPEPVLAGTVYDFSGKAVAGQIPVTPDMTYTAERGYGFEPGSTVKAGAGCITSDQPYYFSIALPEGNHRVSITVGDDAGESNVTVKSELRRLMLEKVTTQRGSSQVRTFSVNVKTPAISTGGQVRLKGQREAVQEIFNWDPKLTLYFGNARPSIRSIRIEKVDIPTVFILGDSTSCDQMAEPYSSWGQSITRFFKPGVAVANHGESGESMAAAVGAKRVDKIYDTIKTGDYLFIQFAHNDMKATGSNALANYKQGLKNAVEEARKRGATPVLITPCNRRTFRENAITNSFVTNSGDDYLAAVHEIAKETGAALIDLNAMTKTLYESFGPEKSAVLFATTARGVDGTHHNNYGSYELAKCVLMGIKQNKLDLAKFITDDFTGFDPAKPDALETFTLPADPPRSTERPPGS